MVELVDLFFFGRNISFAILLWILTVMFEKTIHNDSRGAILFILIAICVVIMGIQAIKRLHDINLSGWWYLVLLIPYINFIFGIYILLNSGSKGINAYGSEPNAI
jgi:uncharacterized membrane protein YhaH (DUF805 family)